MNIIKYLLLLALILQLGQAEAHPLPQCKAQLVVNEQSVLIHFKAPAEIVELAQKRSLKPHDETSVDSLRSYVLKHISISDTLKSSWKMAVGKVYVQETNDQVVGNYLEVVIDISLTPSKAESLKNFILNCDLIIHQIPTQAIIFSIEQDWENGIIENNSKQIGIISLDIPTGKIKPLQIQLEKGSIWQGFKSTISLGIRHIAEGTDHILFIITLLFPAMLMAENKRWTKSLEAKDSLKNLIKIITAFTIGHSLTLILGSLHWISIPSKPIEILIAITILISAIHTLRPLYPNKEMYIAGAFGLIHGMAFAETLTNLELSTKQLIISILGFNIGIEIMQLIIILFAFLCLFCISRTRYYTLFRLISSFIIILLAIGWLIERIEEKPNFITQFIV